jgi:hypothetical protein
MDANNIQKINRYKKPESGGVCTTCANEVGRALPLQVN